MGMVAARRRIWPGRRWLAACVIGLIAVAAWAGYIGRKYPTVSPFTSTVYLIQHIRQPHARLEREVVGFMPYWQEDDARYAPLELLSEVVFFALTADEHGRLVTETDGKPEPGWRAWTSSPVRDQIARSQIAGSKFALSVAQHDGVKLGAFLDDPSAQQALIAALTSQIADNHLDGLNLDFEFTGLSTPAHRQVFTDFSRGLVTAVRAKTPAAELSIDLPAIAADRPGLYDVPALAQLFDRVVVMSYDYYTPGSDVAGPVAPIHGRGERYFFDMTTTYDEYSQAVPAAKILMGVPLYGYDWPVDDNSKPLPHVLEQGDHNGFAEVVSYRRMKTEPNLSGQNCHWDDSAEETWCDYLDPRTNVQRRAWLEDDSSIAAKFDMAKQRQLGGVALWTLGFAGPDPQPWKMLRQAFTTSS